MKKRLKENKRKRIERLREKLKLTGKLTFTEWTQAAQSGIIANKHKTKNR